MQCGLWRYDLILLHDVVLQSIQFSLWLPWQSVRIWSVIDNVFLVGVVNWLFSVVNRLFTQHNPSSLVEIRFASMIRFLWWCRDDTSFLFWSLSFLLPTIQLSFLVVRLVLVLLLLWSNPNSLYCSCRRRCSWLLSSCIMVLVALTYKKASCSRRL